MQNFAFYSSHLVLIGLKSVSLSYAELMAAAASVTAGDIIISELMCYATGKFQNVPRDSLKSILATFYTPSEVSAAKETFYRIADELAVDGLPRAVSRRKSDDRTRGHCAPVGSSRRTSFNKQIAEICSA